MYVISPASYSRCASAMVFLTPKLMRVLAACCSVEVMNGGLGFDWVGLSSRAETTNEAPLRALSATSVASPLVGLNALPACRAT